MPISSIGMDTVVLGLRVILAGVFAVAALAKLADIEGSRRALEDFHVPARLARPMGALLPLAEATTAAALLIAPSARWGAVAAVILLGGFAGGITFAMVRGEAPSCHCFGQISSSPAGFKALLRNILLLAAAGLIAGYGRGQGLGPWIKTHSAAALVAVLAVAAAVVLAGLLVRYWRRSRELERELGRARDSLAAFPAGLPVGAKAPEFTLQDLDGRVRTLADLLAAGKPVALMFVSPHCEPCRWLMPDVARWQTTLSDRLTIALLATGARKEIESLAEAFQLKHVLLQKGSEVFDAYRARATPSGVLVTPDGSIGSHTNSTGPILESLIRTILNSDFVPPAVHGVPVSGDSPLAVQQWKITT
jgi:thiol-disulfide isomerase/thioredoxin